jgi:integral membrane protein
VEAAWKRYRIMSFVAGTTLLLLCVVLILHHTVSRHVFDDDGISTIDRIVGIGHGLIIYPIYLICAGLFAIKARVGFGVMALMLLAGFVPGLAFYMEHWVGIRYGMIKEPSA